MGIFENPFDDNDFDEDQTLSEYYDHDIPACGICESTNVSDVQKPQKAGLTYEYQPGILECQDCGAWINYPFDPLREEWTKQND